MAAYYCVCALLSGIASVIGIYKFLEERAERRKIKREKARREHEAEAERLVHALEKERRRMAEEDRRS